MKWDLDEGQLSRLVTLWCVGAAVGEKFNTEAKRFGALSEQSLVTYGNQVGVPVILSRRQNQIGSNA